MKVYLVRHGDAVMPDVDPARPLSERGRDEARRLGEFMAQRGVQVEEVWHSAKVRARETAEIINETGNLGGALREQQGLLPDDDIGGIASALEAAGHDVCAVGHLPFMAYLVAEMADGFRADFQTGSAICLERQGSGSWAMSWFVSPSELA